MILCLEFGNTGLYGGLYDEGIPVLKFRKAIHNALSSDELGIFLRSVLRENDYSAKEVVGIAYCSVAPDCNHAIEECCVRYFGITPFSLKPGVKTGLRIKYANPKELGSDRIAAAIGGYSLFPKQDMIIVNLGTATTFDILTEEKEYLGGAILPGLQTGMHSLEEKTAKLPVVEIIQPDKVCGRSTVESIQVGVYYGHLGAIKEIIRLVTKESFKGKTPLVVGTGGFSRLFDDVAVFDRVEPDLVLNGICKAQEINS